MQQVKTTFKSLSGGRFRCNQTNEVVKAGRTDSYRRVRDMKLLGQNERKTLLKRQAQEKRMVEQAKKARERQQDSWRTPSFGRSMGMRTSFDRGY